MPCSPSRCYFPQTEISNYRRCLRHITGFRILLRRLCPARRYKKRFPELEGLVLEPLAYARVVERIGNEDNVIAIDLEDVIPRHVQMTVSVSASTTDGQPLPADDLQRVLDACKLAQRLDGDRAKLHSFVGSRMALVAPNLSAVCGAEIAAKLVGAAGGLEPLSTMPACNIQVRPTPAHCIV